MFLGKTPSDFHMNAAVKAFIMSESFLWPAWNFMAPIMAIFAANSLPGGSIETAGFAYSIHLVVRVVFELISGKFLAGSHTRKKIYVIITGISIVSVAYLNLAFSTTISHFYLSMGIAGMGFGLISPAKNSMFSTHLDKDRESVEWGITDATVFISIALAASLGGLIASKYGFHVLFSLAAWVNTLAAFPYAIYLYKKHPHLKAESHTKS
jgi:MFS family permease